MSKTGVISDLTGGIVMMTLALLYFLYYIVSHIFMKKTEKGVKPAIAAMHGPHSVFDIGHCTVIAVMPEVCRWLKSNEKQRKTDIHLTDQ